MQCTSLSCYYSYYLEFNVLIMGSYGCINAYVNQPETNDGIVFYDNSGDLSYSCVGKLFVYPMAVVNKRTEKRWSAGFYSFPGMSFE